MFQKIPVISHLLCTRWRDNAVLRFVVYGRFRNSVHVFIICARYRTVSILLLRAKFFFFLSSMSWPSRYLFVLFLRIFGCTGASCHKESRSKRLTRCASRGLRVVVGLLFYCVHAIRAYLSRGRSAQVAEQGVVGKFNFGASSGRNGVVATGQRSATLDNRGIIKYADFYILYSILILW